MRVGHIQALNAQEREGKPSHPWPQVSTLEEEKNQTQYEQNYWNVKYEGKISVKTKEKQGNEEPYLWKSAELNKNKADKTTAIIRVFTNKKTHKHSQLDTRKYCE